MLEKKTSSFIVALLVLSTCFSHVEIAQAKCNKNKSVESYGKRTWGCLPWPTVTFCVYLAAMGAIREFKAHECCKVLIDNCTGKGACQFNQLCSEITNCH